MKVVTILGTRPEIIRLSRVIARLDAACEHVVVHTGQNREPSLSDVFFDELGIRSPDHHLRIGGDTFAARIGDVLKQCEVVLRDLGPDRVLVLGDTDSALSAFVAKRLGIPVYHMEAGNRCFDDRVPEEVNRRVIDHSSDVLLPYTERSRSNLLREGIASSRIIVTGNPINEVLRYYAQQIDGAVILDHLDLTPNDYVLVTAHRQETVDVEGRLRSLAATVRAVALHLGLPVVCSVHPRTRDRLDHLGLSFDGAGVRSCPPFGFVDFVRLERDARLVLTDSGTVQEECCILGVPAVTVRDTTERPETVECGSNTVAGVETAAVLRCVDAALDGARTWEPPTEYLATDVSRTVTAILVGSAVH